MIKIKDDADLKKLEKLGFKYDKKKNIYCKEIKTLRTECIVILEPVFNSCMCYLKVNDNMICGDKMYVDDALLEIIYDLTKADIIEKGE